MLDALAMVTPPVKRAGRKSRLLPAYHIGTSYFDLGVRVNNSTLEQLTPEAIAVISAAFNDHSYERLHFLRGDVRAIPRDIRGSIIALAFRSQNLNHRPLLALVERIINHGERDTGDFVALAGFHAFRGSSVDHVNQFHF